MAEQQVFFEQGSPTTGDSGERDDSSAIKPTQDGERASEDNFNRPLENIRLRTEVLRDVAEEFLYKDDAGMRWSITGGNISGLGAPIPEVGNWDWTAGTFSVVNNLVIQPLNTPDEDKAGTIDYSFDDGTTVANVTFDVDTSIKRSYSGANLLRIKWLTATASELASAVVPNYCDIEVSGDPDHILTITIRDDNLTQMANLYTALEDGTIKPLMNAMGILATTGGIATTYLEYGDIPDGSTPPYRDYRDYYLDNTFERELHYLSAAVLNSYVAANPLSDGDTLAIWFNYYNQGDAGDDGRRQRIPSNTNTTVSSGELFITSANPERIPNCIPLCKRIGTHLYWLDGTVVTSDQSASTLVFGEHGTTVQRITQAVTTDIWAMDATITGHWRYNSPISFNKAIPSDPVIIDAQAPSTTITGSVSYINFSQDIETNSAGSPPELYGVSSNFNIDYPDVASVNAVAALRGKMSFYSGSFSSTYRGGANGVRGEVFIGGTDAKTFSAGSPVYGTYGYVNLLGGGFTTFGGPIAGVGARLDLTGIIPNVETYGLYSKVMSSAGPVTNAVHGAKIVSESHSLFADYVNLYGMSVEISSNTDMGTSAGGSIIGVNADVLSGGADIDMHGGYIIGSKSVISSLSGCTDATVIGNDVYLGCTASAATTLNNVYMQRLQAIIQGTSGNVVNLANLEGSTSVISLDSEYTNATSCIGVQRTLGNRGAVTGSIYDSKSTINLFSTGSAGDIYGKYLSVSCSSGATSTHIYGSSKRFTIAASSNISGELYSNYTVVIDTPKNHGIYSMYSVVAGSSNVSRYITNSTTDVDCSTIQLGRSMADTEAMSGVPGDGDMLGLIQFLAWTGSNFTSKASLYAVQEGTSDVVVLQGPAGSTAALRIEDASVILQGGVADNTVFANDVSSQMNAGDAYVRAYLSDSTVTLGGRVQVARAGNVSLSTAIINISSENSCAYITSTDGSALETINKTAAAQGEIIILMNASSFNITLSGAGNIADSASASRLEVGCAGIFVYDNTTSKWFPVVMQTPA